jgi:hypothetical protein
VYSPDISLGATAAASAAALASVASVAPSSEVGRRHGLHHQSHTSGSGDGGGGGGAIQRLTVQEASSLTASSARYSFPMNVGSDSVGGGGGEDVSLRPVAMHEPTMPQGLAWHLAMHALRRRLIQRAKKQILDRKGALVDIHVELQVGRFGRASRGSHPGGRMRSFVCLPILCASLDPPSSCFWGSLNAPRGKLCPGPAQILFL